ncbi:MAG: alpha-glucan family phosphorylase [Chloroflexi bacterium]|nr:alpha-glucan family phosphorylase [Chloroflexota bacterium]
MSLDVNLISDERAEKPFLPARIGRLYELANNLWWSWHEDGRQLFRSLDYALWRTTGHNPVKQLHEVSRGKLQAAATDPVFLEIYDSVMAQFDADMSGEQTWFNETYRDKLPGPVAYFSAEFAIHSSLPIYAGGLGVLAGDICKEASDLGLPLIAVGFMYPQGYIHQHISADGWQQEVYTQLNFGAAPISPCPWIEACAPLVPVQLAGRTLYLTIWLVRVGRVNLYLLDTNVEQNTPQDRTLSARLYTTDVEQRMQQLIVLGSGGVKSLRMLGINPSVWHANEDHIAFMMLERLREEIEKGASFEQAISNVRDITVFTTHTPVPAGHNVLPVDLIDRYFKDFWGSTGISRKDFLALGQHEGLDADKFSLTALALKLSERANAVSKLHGKVTRKMWQNLWPGVGEEDVPITHVTNGVHLPTWQAPEMSELCHKHAGPQLLKRQDDVELWKCVVDIPDEEFWAVRQLLKTRLIRLIQDRAQQRWVEDAIPTQQVLSMGALLDTYPLTIVFSRRFTAYKRPGLILSDVERLKKIINNPSRPVQIIFAGKSHPADIPGKNLIKQVFSLTADRQFQGRIAFVEDYDMHLAREMVRGVDVWLNNPRRLEEASGTSGMKAAMNGVLNLSVRDGWWDEGYNGANGWAINGSRSIGRAEEDKADADALYDLLENEIVPLYYERDRMGIPHRWVQFAKEAIKSVSPAFCASRMVKEYVERMYLPAASVANRK